MANNPKHRDNLKHFSKTHQPANPGRKPHLMSDTIAALTEAGYKAVGKEEITKIWAFYLNLPQKEITRIATNINRPMSERIIAKKLLGAKGDEALSEIQDRIFGKPDQKQNVNGDITIKVIRV